MTIDGAGAVDRFSTSSLAAMNHIHSTQSANPRCYVINNHHRTNDTNSYNTDGSHSSDCNEKSTRNAVPLSRGSSKMAASRSGAFELLALPSSFWSPHIPLISHGYIHTIRPHTRRPRTRTHAEFTPLVAHVFTRRTAEFEHHCRDNPPSEGRGARWASLSFTHLCFPFSFHLWTIHGGFAVCHRLDCHYPRRGQNLKFARAAKPPQLDRRELYSETAR